MNAAEVDAASVMGGDVGSVSDLDDSVREMANKEKTKQEILKEIKTPRKEDKDFMCVKCWLPVDACDQKDKYKEQHQKTITQRRNNE